MTDQISDDDRPLVLSSRRGDVVTLTLNRPEALNATLPGMVPALALEFDRAVEGGARAIVLTGAGRAFCAGAYLKGGGQKPGEKDMGEGLEKILNPLIEKLLTIPVPIVSAVNGPAVGAGVGLALAGDILIAAKSAYFMLAFSKVGLVADAGLTWQLPRLVGRQRALEMMYLAEKIPAEEAQRLGLVNRGVGDSDLEAVATDIAARIAAGPTATYAAIRQGVKRSLESDLAESLTQEAVAQRAAGFRADFVEGVTAFAEKRPARFVGR
jgi:2-(1,2-epoxy-1,2-dihydrophenyl)acetyl-CoA isomerase